MLNIIPDLEQFSLGEPGGSVSASPARKSPAKKTPSAASAARKCAAKKTTSAASARKCASRKKTSEPVGSFFPALDAGPSGPAFSPYGGGGMFQDGPSGPAFDGPSGPMR